MLSPHLPLVRVETTTLAKDSKVGKLKAEAGRLVVSIILKSFIDARLFGSSLAFKDWDIEPRPKTLTGAVQINMGEVLHQALEVDIAGTSTFASKEENRQGTFTTYHALRYGLIGFNGVANEHSARLSQLTDADYERFLGALWRSVSGAPTANTRSKMGQVPRLLVDIAYKPGSEFQFGCLINYAKVVPRDKAESAIASPDDYVIDLGRLADRLTHPCVQRVRCALHPDIRCEPGTLPWEPWDLDRIAEGRRGGPDDAGRPIPLPGTRRALPEGRDERLGPILSGSTPDGPAGPDRQHPGLGQGRSPRVLGDAAVAVGGKVPRRHYHRSNVRKAFPAALPLWIKPAKAPEA